MNNLLDHLAGLFEDQHREITAERDYEELTMSNSDEFRSFFYEFSRLADVLEYELDNRHVISTMKRKLPSRLRDLLMDKSFKSMTEYRDYLYRVDDNQRADWKYRIKFKETSKVPTRRITTTTTAVAPVSSRALVPKASLQPSPDLNCYTCGKPNCLPSRHEPGAPQTTAGRATQLAARGAKANEIEVNEVTGEEPDSDESESDEDSKN